MGVDIVIPPVPRGDPRGMRELADLCRTLSAQLGTVGDDVTALPKTMTFEGDASTRFGDRMQSLGSQLGDAAAELQDDVGRLQSAAAEVERLLAEREAAIRRMEELRAQAAGAVL